MAPTGPPTLREIWRVARTATDILEQQGISCCLFGGAACSLWADIQRVPGDVDIVVMDQYQDAEDIKETIAANDSRFFLVNSRNTAATYRVLWYRLPGYATSSRAVKVDILVPPTELDLPFIDDSEISCINQIPVMPLFPLLLLKVQGWWHHRTSQRSDFRAKEDADIDDIDALLEVAKDNGIHLTVEHGVWEEDFVETGEWHVQKFMRIPGFRASFRALGFNV